MEIAAEHQVVSDLSSSVLPEKLHEKLERKGSKQKLAKQLEVMEECERTALTYTPVILRHSSEDEQSPNSEKSDCTVVLAAEKESVPNDSACTTLKVSLPEDCGERVDSKKEIEDKGSGNVAQVVSVKVRLVRSKAVCDDVSSSPPPDIHIYQDSTQTAPSNTTLMLSPNIAVRNANRHKLGHDNSQGSSMSDGGTSPALSRDSSFDAAYTDSTGTNLEEFIIRTLNKNRNDCAMLLRLENDMINFIKDNKEDKHKFPQMSSYHRMLVHRISAFFGLEHNVDDSGKCVVINRSANTRLPEFKFRDHIWEELTNDDQPKKLILRRHRDCTSLEETLDNDRISVDERKSKSFEEREEEYIEARNRIFQQEVLVYQEDAKSHVSSRPDKLSQEMNSSSKGEVYWLGNDVRPWSSTDSSGYSTDGSCRLRVSVTKASSFHGVTVLTRGDSNSSGTSRLSKTDSTSSGVSGLSSPVIIPPIIPCASHNELLPPNGMDVSTDQTVHATGVMNQASNSPFLSFTDEQGEPLAIWVASTIDQIPPGSFIINPQTGKPYTNPDGSMYKWFPPCHNSDENSSAQRFTSVPLPAHCAQDQLASNISALSINSPEAICAVPSNYTLSAGQFCIQPQPLHVMCQPDIGGENRPDLYMSPTQAVAGSGGTTALQLITLPQMTVQSIESYPVTMQLQSSVIQQQTSIQQSQPYCIELGQLKPDVNYKGNASPVFYAPVGIQMQVPAQAARYHIAGSVPAPYQPVVYSEHLTETGTSTPSKLRYLFYSTDSAMSQHPYAVNAAPAHNVLPPTSCSSASSSSVHVRSGDQLVFGPGEVQPRAVAYRHPTVVAGESRTVQQNLQMSFHQDLVRLRIPRLSESSQIVQQTPTASGFQQNVATWPAQPMSSSYVEACGSSTLQVCGLPPGLHHTQLEPYLADLVMVHGARRIDVVQNASDATVTTGAINVANCTVLAIFDSETAAQKAIASNAACGGKYQLVMLQQQQYHS